MKKILVNLFLLSFLMLAFSIGTAMAAKPLKGNWTAMVQTPMGTLPIPVSFKAKGKGTVTVPTGALAISYREKDTTFSIAFEGPGLAPDGTDLTFVFRGTKTDSSFSGTAYAITENADPSSPVGFAAVPLPFTGSRN